MRRVLVVFVMLASVNLRAQTYPVQASNPCGAGLACAALIARWNQASWHALVDDSFQAGSPALAAVRKYDTEGACTGVLCADQLSRRGSLAIDPVASQFVGVTDEL